MTRRSLLGSAAVAGFLIAMAAQSARAESAVTFQRLSNPEPQNWLLPHRTYDGWRYSPLDQITPANVANLKLAFAFPLGSFKNTWSGEQVPLVDDGMLYVTNSLSVVRKLDVRSGKRAAPLWSFDPQVSTDVIGRITNRGVALNGDKALFTTSDGRAIALKRETGEAVWEKVTIDNKAEGHSAQPITVKDLMLFGQSRGDRATRGWIKALDVNTGELRWRFNTVPSPGEPGFETWPQNSNAWEVGGAAIWTPGHYDVATNTVYYGTGNAAPAYDPEFRPGDNLYTSSVIALNADTGKLLWYFQYQPNEGLELDEITPHLLIDTRVGNETRKVIAHHSVRNGHYYLLDRTNGQFILGARNAPSVNWTAGLDPKTGKPVEYDPTKRLQSYGGRNARRTEFGMSGCQAASSWGGQAYDPDLNRVYSLINDSCYDRMTGPPPGGFAAGYAVGKVGAGGNVVFGIDRPAPNAPLAALRANLVGPRLTATNVSTGEIVAFAKALDENPNGNAQGGTLATKSKLVFFGHANGTLSAYDSSTLANLWSVNVGTPFRSPPISYAVGGKQYIAITGGGDSTGALANLSDAPMLWVFTL